MDLGAILQAASVVVALSGVAGFAVVRESLKQVRDQNRDLRDEVGDLDRRHEQDQATIARQASELVVLHGVVTNEVGIKAIEDMQEHNHAEEMAVLREIRDLLGRRS